MMKPPNSRTFFELLAEQAERAPHAEFIVADARRHAYRDVHRMAAILASGLRDRGLARGDRIALLCDNRIEWIEVFFAAAALGVSVVPFSTWSTVDELEFLIADSRVRLLFSIERFASQTFVEPVAALRASGRAPNLEALITIDGPAREGIETLAGWRAHTPLDARVAGASARDEAMVLYTSGSSSRPKSVPLLHFAAIENGFNIGERQGQRPDDRTLVSVPLFWAYGAVNALPVVLSHGGAMVLQPAFEPGGALDLIERERCTAIYTLPAMTNALLAHPSFAAARTRSLRTGVTIGAPQDLVNAASRLGAAEICNIYGGTEGYGNCCVTPHDWPLDRRAACQGPPLPGVTVRIMQPETDVPCAPGEIGDIQVSGYLTPGYDGHSAQHNVDAFTADGFFRTGDLGSIGEDGAIRFAGRSSEMIKRSGINVSPAEVEEALLRDPAVALAAVTGAADAGRDEIIVAFLIPKPDQTIDVDAVRALCRQRLSRYKVPDRIFVTDRLPLTVTGKLMRRELRQIAAERVAQDSGVNP